MDRFQLMLHDDYIYFPLLYLLLGETSIWLYDLVSDFCIYSRILWHWIRRISTNECHRMMLHQFHPALANRFSLWIETNAIFGEVNDFLSIHSCWFLQSSFAMRSFVQRYETIGLLSDLKATLVFFTQLITCHANAWAFIPVQIWVTNKYIY